MLVYLGKLRGILFSVLSRFLTPSRITQQEFVISGFSTEARTPSTGQAGMGSVWQTAASPSGPRRHYEAQCKDLLLPQDCKQVASGALFACTLWVCPSFVFQLLFTAELLQAQPFGRASVFIFHGCYSNYWCPSREKLGQLNMRSIFSS